MQRLGAKFRVRSRIDWYSFLSVKYISQRILLAQLWFVIYSKDEWFHVVCVALSSVSHITEWGPVPHLYFDGGSNAFLNIVIISNIPSLTTRVRPHKAQAVVKDVVENNGINRVVVSQIHRNLKSFIVPFTTLSSNSQHYPLYLSYESHRTLFSQSFFRQANTHTFPESTQIYSSSYYSPPRTPPAYHISETSGLANEEKTYDLQTLSFEEHCSSSRYGVQRIYHAQDWIYFRKRIECRKWTELRR